MGTKPSLMPWLSEKRARAEAFLDWLPTRLGEPGQAELLRRMRWGLGLVVCLSALAWGSVWATRPGARARAYRIILERQLVMADLGSEAYRRGAIQVARQASIVASTDDLPSTERDARLRDLERVATELGAKHFIWRRLAEGLSRASQDAPTRIWGRSTVGDPYTGHQIWVTATQQQIEAHYLAWLRQDTSQQQLVGLAARYAQPGAPPIPILDAGSEFDQ